MSLLQVGAGSAYIMDLTQTPAQRIEVGLLKSGKAGFKQKMEFESGAMQMAMYAATLETEITGELTFKALDIALLKSVGLAQLAGSSGLSRIAVVADPKTVAATVTLTGSTDILSIRDTTTGKYFTKVASAPTAFQYSFAPGTVTFAAGDVGKAVTISWIKAAATENNRLNLINAVQQQSQYFGVEGLGLFDGKQAYYNFPRVVATDMPDIFGAGDKFADRKLAFKVVADPLTGAIGEISLTETLT